MVLPRNPYFIDSIPKKLDITMLDVYLVIKL
jgi:hypothetical protein